MPNLKTLELKEVNIADGFFLALKTSASEAMLESIIHSRGPDISAAASEAYAKSICTMPNLKTLELKEVNIADGFFLALKTSASEARLESIRHCGGPSISAAALQAYAQKIICTMPNLRTLELNDVRITDDFYLALAELASRTRLESIKYSAGPDISPAAAEAYAKSICTMPNLKSLELKEVNIADGFFLALKTSASEALLELIRHYGRLDISAAASEAYAKSICTMPNLKTLELEEVNIADGFFLALKISASEARLELIRHYGRLDISAAASEAYAKSICTMPNLKTLELEEVNIADGFFLALKTSASEARLESIRHFGGPSISAAALQAYAQKIICTMPNLRTLELENARITEDFYLTLAEIASRTRLESIRHCGGPSISAAALHAYTQSISTMPNLRDLELKNVIIADNISVSLTTSASTFGLWLSMEFATISVDGSKAFAEIICTMPNLRTLELENARITDDFYLTLAELASRTRLESIRHCGGPSISAAAFQAYAQKIICTMPNLRTLELENARITDDFYLTLAELASRTRLESIRHCGGPSISAAAFQAYAQKIICTMPNLRTLELEDARIKDDFYLTLAESASRARLESIRHFGGPSISAAALHAYAQSISTMPNLRDLELKNIIIADSISISLTTSASTFGLWELSMALATISVVGSRALAEIICTMPNLRTLELEDARITDDFYLTLAESASRARLESIRHCGGPSISAAALHAYAQSISTMPNLRDLELKNVIIADNISISLTTSASTFGLWTWESPFYGHDGSAQFLYLCQLEGSDILAATWQALVQFICAVSHPLSLERAYIGHGAINGISYNFGCWIKSLGRDNLHHAKPSDSKARGCQNHRRFLPHSRRISVKSKGI
ncbi:uncharacterized protein [Diadema setosum]|uniref:uncharacterized protein n=1 Tax=Diadema setosum TaxID=31175 RepID=UPI003B3A2751